MNNADVQRAPVSHGHVEIGFLSHAANESVGLPDGPVSFSLRPECIRLAHAVSAQNAVYFRARVVDYAFHGASELVRVEASHGHTMTVRTSSHGKLRGEAELEFDPADAVPVRRPK